MCVGCEFVQTQAASAPVTFSLVMSYVFSFLLLALSWISLMSKRFSRLVFKLLQFFCSLFKKK